MAQILISRYKKGIAAILASLVLLTGLLTITSQPADASSSKVVFNKSKDGKHFTVTKNGVTVFEANQLSDSDAVVTYTPSKDGKSGKTLKIKMHVDRLSDSSYKTIVTDENTGKSNEVLSKNNPFDQKLNQSIVKPSSAAPNALLYYLINGGFDNGTSFALGFGPALAYWIADNWGALVDAWNSYGYWAVFYMILDSEVIAPCLVAGVVA